MKLLDAIKTLKPGERLKALVILAIISSLTGLATVWLKGNPCKDIGDQYTQMLKNYSEMAKSNNALMSDNNQKQDMILSLKGILQKLDSTKSQTFVKVEEIKIPTVLSHNDTIKIDPDIRKMTQMLAKDSQDTENGEHEVRYSMDPVVVKNEKKEEKRIVVVKKITKSGGMSTDQRSLIDSALKITEKIRISKAS